MAAIRASLIRISSRSNATSCRNRSLSALRRTRAFVLSAAQLRVETAAYWAREITCRMAERTRLGQPFGNLKFHRFSDRKACPPSWDEGQYNRHRAGGLRAKWAIAKVAGP